jgi:hypothetical protein
MKSNPEKFNGLWSVLQRAHRDKEVPDVQEPWRADTMRRIRQLSPLNSATIGFFTFGRMVWRLAPVAAALILVISLALMNFDLYPDQGVFDLMTYQSEDIGLLY